jgi:hypothetical protein
MTDEEKTAMNELCRLIAVEKDRVDSMRWWSNSMICWTTRRTAWSERRMCISSVRAFLLGPTRELFIFVSLL